MNDPFATAPTQLTQGDSRTWLASLPDYTTTTGWSLHYRLLWREPPAADIPTTPDGPDHRVVLASSQTLAWRQGAPALAAWVTRGIERINLGTRLLLIAPDPAAATSLDDRSPSQRGLDDARAALASMLAGDMAGIQEYEIAGHRVQFRRVSDLKDLIAHYEAAVAREVALAAAAQGVTAGRIYTRF